MFILALKRPKKHIFGSRSGPTWTRSGPTSNQKLSRVDQKWSRLDKKWSNLNNKPTSTAAHLNHNCTATTAATTSTLQPLPPPPHHLHTTTTPPPLPPPPHHFWSNLDQNWSTLTFLVLLLVNYFVRFRDKTQKINFFGTILRKFP